MRSFRIRGADAVPVHGGLCEPIKEWPDGSGKLAILGLDFGTAFTKAIVRWERRHFAVDWSDAVAGNQFLLPSVFSEHTDGTIVLGSLETGGWARKDSIKLRLLSSSGRPSKDELSDALIFVALAFRHANQWLRKNNSSAKDASIRWQLHLGLPTDSWDDVATTGIFRTIGRAARVLACSQGKVTREGALKALEAADSVGRPEVDVLPEFACQTYSYLESTQRQGDLHALVDVGAGTLDIAFFNVHMEDAENVLPIFAAKVQKLGTHYLLAALSGKNGCVRTWRDEQASMGDADMGAMIGQKTEDVSSRRRHFLNSVGDTYNEAFSEARKLYGSSPIFRQRATMRLFLCGGGGRIPSIRSQVEKIAKESLAVYGVRVTIVNLVRPSELAYVGDDFDRLSVAYGLSQLAATIGTVLRRGDLRPYLVPGGLELRDRDEDR